MALTERTRERAARQDLKDQEALLAGNPGHGPAPLMFLGLQCELGLTPCLFLSGKRPAMG